MAKLELHFDPLKQTNFELSKLNFLFVFQVNCPGCFIHGIPLMNSLFKKFKDQVSFLGLSTAFEDYDFNTLNNTEALLNDSIMVGETKKYFAQNGLEKYPNPILFPVAMDKILTNEFGEKKAITLIAKSNPNYTIWPKFEQEEMRLKVKQYLRSMEKVSLTFSLNLLKGTPSFILFNNHYQIIDHWFGHQKEELIKDAIETVLKRN